MAAFEPVLSRNWNVADSHTLKVYESRGGLPGCAEGAGERSRFGGRRSSRTRSFAAAAARGFRAGSNGRSFPRTGRKRSCASTPTRASRPRSTTGC